MKRLYDKTILIGREQETSRLLVAIPGVGKRAIGPEASIPKSVSRCTPESQMAHASIVIDSSGNMVLKNMKNENMTYVNGSQVLSKRIGMDSTIELGRDHTPIPTSLILNSALQIVGGPVVDGGTGGSVNGGGQINGGSQVKVNPDKPTYSLDPAADVWYNYQRELKEIQEKQKKLNLMRSLQGLLSLTGITMGIIIPDFGWIFTILAFVIAGISFIKTKNDDSQECREEAMRRFQDSYLCPNPNCGRSLPSQSFAWLKRNYTQCSYCKCKYTTTRS